MLLFDFEAILNLIKVPLIFSVLVITYEICHEAAHVRWNCTPKDIKMQFVLYVSLVFSVEWISWFSSMWLRVPPKVAPQIWRFSACPTWRFPEVRHIVSAETCHRPESPLLSNQRQANRHCCSVSRSLMTHSALRRWRTASCWAESCGFELRLAVLPALLFWLLCAFHKRDFLCLSDLSASTGSKVLVVTANAWSGEQSYLSVVQTNVDLYRGIVPGLARLSPNAVMIVASQPGGVDGAMWQWRRDAGASAKYGF